MEFFNQTGKMAIGSRLKMLTDKIMEDALQIYKLYGTDLKTKWFPVFFVLSKGEEKTITNISKEIGHSHTSVSNIVREMLEFGVITSIKDETDGRTNTVKLSKKGNIIAEKVKEQFIDVNSAVENILNNSKYNLWNAIEEWEYLLSEKSMLRRVQEEKKLRESQYIEIVNYEPRYENIFKSLNEEWISKYFKMEEADHKALNHPDEYIMQKGGCILVALYKGEAVGVCALIKMEDKLYQFEVAKMAVSPKTQGKNIGWILGNAIIEKAKELGALNLYLESNTKLNAAINLYKKLGFQKVVNLNSSPYERANIQMDLKLYKNLKTFT